MITYIEPYGNSSMSYPQLDHKLWHVIHLFLILLTSLSSLTNLSIHFSRQQELLKQMNDNRSNLLNLSS